MRILGHILTFPDPSCQLDQFFWSKIACTGVPHIVDTTCFMSNCTSGGHFRPSKVSFSQIFAIFYKAKLLWNIVNTKNGNLVKVIYELAIFGQTYVTLVVEYGIVLSYVWQVCWYILLSLGPKVIVIRAWQPKKMKQRLEKRKNDPKMAVVAPF